MNVKCTNSCAFAYILFYVVCSLLHATGKEEEIITSPLPSAHLLVLENTCAVFASDATKPPFKGGLYYIEWASGHNPEITGAFIVMGSQHNFPIQRLPLAYQRIIYGCNNFDFLFHETSKEDYYKSEDVQEVITEKIKTSSFSEHWFDTLSKRKTENLKRILKIEDEIDQTDIICHFNALNPNLVASSLYSSIVYGDVEKTMDTVAYRHSEKWEGLESKEQRKGELKSLNDPWFNINGRNAVAALLSLSPKQCRAFWELLIFGEEPDDFETVADRLSLSPKQYPKMQQIFKAMESNDDEETNKRNLYWLNESFPKIFQPGKIGLIMFGLAHESGRYGIITKLLRVFLSKKPWHGIIIKNMKKLIR